MSAQPAPEPTEPAAPDTAVGDRESDPPHLTPVPDTGPEQPEPDHDHDPAPADPVDESDTADPSVLARVTDLLRGEFSPPDLWREGRPSLSKVWHYARYSEQMPPGGPVRVAAMGYGGLAVAVTAAGYTAAWLAERTTRLAMFALGLTLAAVFPPTRAVLTVLLTPLYLLIELITNYPEGF